MKKLILLGAFAFSFYTLTAQTVSYKVLAVKGENAVEQSITPNKFTPLMTGMKLQSKDKIILGDDAYLGLASSSGKTIELRAKGIYNVSDLSGKFVQTTLDLLRSIWSTSSVTSLKRTDMRTT